MTRENLISRERHQTSPTYSHVAKVFLESEVQRKGNKQPKKCEFSAKSCVFSEATDSEHKTIQILQRKGQSKISTDLSSLGQEPTFKM